MRVNDRALKHVVQSQRHGALLPSPPTTALGMSQPKRQNAAKRAANNPLLAKVRKQEGRVKTVFILKLEGCKFLPPHYIVQQGFAQAFASTSHKWLWRYTCHFIIWSPMLRKCSDPLLQPTQEFPATSWGSHRACVCRKMLHSLLGQAELARMSSSSLFNWLEICLQPFHPAQNLNAAIHTDVSILICL